MGEKFFIGHVFDDQSIDDLRDAISNAFIGTEYIPVYADELLIDGHILNDKIFPAIDECIFGLYEISNHNKPNTFIEFGYAKGRGKKCFLLISEKSSPPSDLAGFDRISYSSYKDLTRQLKKLIILNENDMDSPLKSLLDIINLKNVSFFHTWPNIDIDKEKTGEVKCSIVGRREFKFGAPKNSDEIISEIIKCVDKVSTSDEQAYKELYEKYRKRFVEDQFSAVDIFQIEENDEHFNVFNSLITNHDLINQVKNDVLKSFLLKKDGCGFNGSQLALKRLSETRSMLEEPSFLIELQKTDYYSYRIIYELAKKVRKKYGFDAYLKNGFSEYIAQGIQQNVHLSVSIAVIVRTLADNKIIITRRSSNAANNAGEAGNYFMSVNESLTGDDINKNRPGEICLYDVIKRGLDEELGINKKSGLDSKIESCTFTGSFLYLPNLSVNLCFYVALDCSSEELRKAYIYARDGGFETSSIIREEKWDKITGLPAYDTETIKNFVLQSIGSNQPYDIWDEGALAALLLAGIKENY